MQRSAPNPVRVSNAQKLLRVDRISDRLYNHAEAALAMRRRFMPGGTGLGADRKVRPLERRALEARLHAQRLSVAVGFWVDTA